MGGLQSRAGRPPTRTYATQIIPIDLPAGWRLATAFMDAFAATGGEPELGGRAEDYVVLTEITEEEKGTPIELGDLCDLCGKISPASSPDRFRACCRPL